VLITSQSVTLAIADGLPDERRPVAANASTGVPPLGLRAD
jgi:hypothetical protein